MESEGSLMSTNAMRKLSATFLVLVMALSALGYLPLVMTGQAAGTKNIYVPVFSNGSPVSDATVTLTDVHTGDVISAAYSSARSSYVVTNAPSGYFRIDVVHSDYYDALSADELMYDGFSNYTVNPIELTEFPFKNYQWNVTVRDAATTHIISGATVGFFDPVAREYVASTNTDVLGRAIVSVFGTAMKGDLELVIKKSLYNTYIEPVNITANNVTTISLSSSMRVTGFVADWNGPATNVVSYLVNTDPGTAWAKRVMKSTGSGMAFDAYAGSFVLVVDAEGDASHVEALNVAASTNLGTIHLENQTQRVDQVNMTFGADYSSFDLDVATTWSYDDTHPALMYTDMGSLRMQIDLTIGNCDGYIDVGEKTAFFDMLETFGPQYVTSQNLLVINDTVYTAGPMTGYVMDLGEGAVADTLGVNYSYSSVYTVHGSLTALLSQYGAIVTARYDKASVDHDYRIALVNGYELVSNMSSTHVEVSGYLQVDVDPLIFTGSTEKVSLTLQTNKVPIPKGALVSSPFVAPIPNETGVITHYIVKVGANATFNASESSDPNGNPLTYIWDFGDSSPVETTANMTIVHNYTAASASVTVTLTVKDVAGLTNSTTIKVVCDNVVPTPVLSVKTIQFDGSQIAIDQNEIVIFNGTYSYDDAAAANDKQGMISYYIFDFGEGNKSDPIPWATKQKNWTHHWESAGTYTMYMNITDVVGHNASTTIIVVVNDTTKPTVDFTSKNLNDSWSTSLKEGATTVFDAGNGTWDNVNNKTTLHYRWYFSSDNTTIEGVGLYNVSHVFEKIGQMTVTLNVTDDANNSNQKVKTITIGQKPRPDMRITSISYDPETFTAGKSGTILVNMTNTGSANATEVVLNFYYVVNGQRTLIGTSSSIEKNGTAVTVVGVNEKVQGKITWTPKDKGTFTIEVTVNSTMQLEEKKFTDADGLTVKQAAWVQFALWGGVAAIIILVPTLLLLRGRLAKREKKGPRREKKEPEEE
jgi:hypothetical protein